MASQLYSVNTLGGNWSVPYLSQVLRHRAQPLFMFRQFIDVQEAVGLGRGDTFNFDKTGNVATQGGTLVNKPATLGSNAKLKPDYMLETPESPQYLQGENLMGLDNQQERLAPRLLLSEAARILRGHTSGSLWDEDMVQSAVKAAEQLRN